MVENKSVDRRLTGWGAFRSIASTGPRLPFRMMLLPNGHQLRLVVYDHDGTTPIYRLRYKQANTREEIAPPQAIAQDIDALRGGAHPVRDGWRTEPPTVREIASGYSLDEWATRGVLLADQDWNYWDPPNDIGVQVLKHFDLAGRYEEMAFARHWKDWEEAYRRNLAENESGIEAARAVVGDNGVMQLQYLHRHDDVYLRLSL